MDLEHIPDGSVVAQVEERSEKLRETSKNRQNLLVQMNYGALSPVDSRCARSGCRIQGQHWVNRRAQSRHDPLQIVCSYILCSMSCEETIGDLAGHVHVTRNTMQIVGRGTQRDKVQKCRKKKSRK